METHPGNLVPRPPSVFTWDLGTEAIVGMELSDFLFMHRYLLVPLLFHAVTSLHPPSFQRNDISTSTTVCTRVLDKSIVDRDSPLGRNTTFIDKIFIFLWLF